MKITEKEIKEFVEMIGVADDFMPLVELTLQKSELALSKLGPMIKNFSGFCVNQTTNNFNQYLANGFTREEAMLLTLNARVALQDGLNRMNTQKK